MKKSVLVLALMVCGVSFSKSFVTSSVSVCPDNEVFSEGRIISEDCDKFFIQENGSGIVFEMNKNGSVQDIHVGDDVIFIKIETPKGRVIVKNIIKK